MRHLKGNPFIVYLLRCLFGLLHQETAETSEATGRMHIIFLTVHVHPHANNKKMDIFVETLLYKTSQKLACIRYFLKVLIIWISFYHQLVISFH